MLQKLHNFKIIHLMNYLVKMSQKKQKGKHFYLRDYWVNFLQILQNVKLLIWGIIGFKSYNCYKIYKLLIWRIIWLNI